MQHRCALHEDGCDTGVLREYVCGGCPQSLEGLPLRVFYPPPPGAEVGHDFGPLLTRCGFGSSVCSRSLGSLGFAWVCFPLVVRACCLRAPVLLPGSLGCWRPRVRHLGLRTPSLADQSRVGFPASCCCCLSLPVRTFLPLGEGGQTWIPVTALHLLGALHFLGLGSC